MLFGYFLHLRRNTESRCRTWKRSS